MRTPRSLSFALIVLLSAVAMAQTPAPKLTIDQLVQIKHPAGHQWTPDGSHVWWTYDDGGVNNVWAAAADGRSQPVQLTNYPDGQAGGGDSGAATAGHSSISATAVSWRCRSAAGRRAPRGPRPPARVDSRSRLTARRVAFVVGRAGGGGGAGGGAGAGRGGGTGEPASVRVDPAAEARQAPGRI